MIGLRFHAGHTDGPAHPFYRAHDSRAAVTSLKDASSVPRGSSRRHIDNWAGCRASNAGSHRPPNGYDTPHNKGDIPIGGAASGGATNVCLDGTPLERARSPGSTIWRMDWWPASIIRWRQQMFGGSVNAYQLKSVLTLAELWAVPVMLDLALIKKLSDAAERTAPRWHGPLEDALRSDLPNEPRENGAGEGVVGDIIQSLRHPRSHRLEGIRRNVKRRRRGAAQRPCRCVRADDV